MTRTERFEIALFALTCAFTAFMSTYTYVRNNYVSKQDLIKAGVFIEDKDGKFMPTLNPKAKP
jgi:hypothetical protein